MKNIKALEEDSLECPGSTINNSFVRFVQPALFHHLILVLYQQLNSFDGSSSGLKDHYLKQTITVTKIKQEGTKIGCKF